MSDKETAAYQKRRRILTVVSLVVVLLLFGWLTWFLTRAFFEFSQTPETFKAFIDSYGWKSRLVALGIQVLQVVVSLIPGELIEVGLGYAFGAVEGTFLCMAGVAIGSSLIFLLTKVIGVRLVEVFISREKIDQLKFINSEKRLTFTLFLLYFIPGTPKDLFTYFAGLTRIRLPDFLAISLIARIPSVVSSTIGGHLFQSENYTAAIILFIVTGGISLLGIFLYNRYLNHKNKKKEKEEQ